MSNHSFQINNLNMWEAKYLKYKKKYALLKQKIIDGGAPSLMTKTKIAIAATVSNYNFSKSQHIKLDAASSAFITKYPEIQLRQKLIETNDLIKEGITLQMLKEVEPILKYSSFIPVIIDLNNNIITRNFTLKQLIDANPLIENIKSTYITCKQNDYYLNNTNTPPKCDDLNALTNNNYTKALGHSIIKELAITTKQTIPTDVAVA